MGCEKKGMNARSGADPTRLRLRGWAKRVVAAEGVCGSRVEVFFAAGHETATREPGALYPSRARYAALEAARGSGACWSVPVAGDVYDLVVQELKQRPDLAAQAVEWRARAASDAHGGAGVSSEAMWAAAEERLEVENHPAQRYRPW